VPHKYLNILISYIPPNVLECVVYTYKEYILKSIFRHLCDTSSYAIYYYRRPKKIESWIYRIVLMQTTSKISIGEDLQVVMCLTYLTKKSVRWPRCWWLQLRETSSRTQTWERAPELGVWFLSETKLERCAGLLFAESWDDTLDDSLV
jgi:hypothetical protein